MNMVRTDRPASTTMARSRTSKEEAAVATSSVIPSAVETIATG